MVTISDLAKYCNVSIATVSMSLNNKGRISSKTREKVLQAVDELGYVYNQVAANLRLSRSNIVGLLIHDITNPFYGEMIAGLSHWLEENDTLLFLANAEESVQRQNKFIESLMSQNVGGVVLCPANNTDIHYLKTLQKRGFPVICIVRPLGNDDFDFVGTNNFVGGQLATEHLIQKGHRNIAFVGGNQYSQVRSHRLGGYVSKLLEYGVGIKEEYIVCCNATRIDGAVATRRLIDRYPEITAFVCYQDIVALGVMRATKDLGMKLGEDLAVVGFDDIPEAKGTSPSLTTISVSAREIGKTAGKILLSRMQGVNTPFKSVIFPPKLIIRES